LDERKNENKHWWIESCCHQLPQTLKDGVNLEDGVKDVEHLLTVSIAQMLSETPQQIVDVSRQLTYRLSIVMKTVGL
jgi:hypothetical protein